MQDQSQVIVFFIIASCATLASIWSLYFIYKHGKSTSISSQLLLALHSTLLLEEIITYPYLYTSNSIVCEMAGFLHYYSGLANMIVTGLLTLHFANYLLFSNVHITHIMITYKSYLIFGFPLITLLPFITQSYGRTLDHWCSVHGLDHTSQIWSVVIFYGWVWIILISSFCLIVYVIFKARVLDQKTFAKVFSSIGLYDTITIICWIPRTIPRLVILVYRFSISPTTYLWIAMPVYLSGIIYAIILYRDRMLLSVDDQGQLAGTAPSTGEIRFTWEDLEEASLMDDYRLSRTISAAPTRSTGTTGTIGGRLLSTASYLSERTFSTHSSTRKQSTVSSEDDYGISMSENTQGKNFGVTKSPLTYITEDEDS